MQHHLQTLHHLLTVGDSIKKGVILCILEAMKIMNELEAEFDCKILELLVQDGEPVSMIRGSL